MRLRNAMTTLQSAALLLLTGGLYTFLFAAPLAGLLWSLLVRVPEQHRQMRLSRVWILAVPLVHMIWLYIAITRVSTSFQRHFAALGRRGQGDCGYSVGLVLVAAVWIMALLPAVAYLLEWGNVNAGIIASGLFVFASFAAYVIRMTSATRAM
jgi:hypothetical protein